MRWVLGLLLGAFLCALPAYAARSSGSKTMTIRLVSVTTQHKVLVDRAPKQFSIGDVIQAKSTLRNEVAQFGRPKGARVGTDVATFAVVSRTRGHVKVTTTLPGGTLRAAGRIGQEPVETIRVLRWDRRIRRCERCLRDEACRPESRPCPKRLQVAASLKGVRRQGRGVGGTYCAVPFTPRNIKEDLRARTGMQGGLGLGT